jgi:hypothetical protein
MRIPVEKSKEYGFLEAFELSLAALAQQVDSQRSAQEKYVCDDFPTCDVRCRKSGLVDGASRNLRNTATP